MVVVWIELFCNDQRLTLVQVYLSFDWVVFGNMIGSVELLEIAELLGKLC